MLGGEKKQENPEETQADTTGKNMEISAQIEIQASGQIKEPGAVKWQCYLLHHHAALEAYRKPFYN